MLDFTKRAGPLLNCLSPRCSRARAERMARPVQPAGSEHRIEAGKVVIDVGHDLQDDEGHWLQRPTQARHRDRQRLGHHDANGGIGEQACSPHHARYPPYPAEPWLCLPQCIPVVHRIHLPAFQQGAGEPQRLNGSNGSPTKRGLAKSLAMITWTSPPQRGTDTGSLTDGFC